MIDDQRQSKEVSFTSNSPTMAEMEPRMPTIIRVPDRARKQQNAKYTAPIEQEMIPYSRIEVTASCRNRINRTACATAKKIDIKKRTTSVEEIA